MLGSASFYNASGPERLSIHSSAASCSPAPLVRWARMKETHEVE
jgi:hypothetical protein